MNQALEMHVFAPSDSCQLLTQLKNHVHREVLPYMNACARPVRSIRLFLLVIV